MMMMMLPKFSKYHVRLWHWHIQYNMSHTIQYVTVQELFPKGSGVTLLEGARGQGMVRCPID